MRKSAELGSSSGREPRTARELVGRAHARGARHVDVDVVRVLRILDHRVGVGAAAGLDVGDVLRVADVGHVEDADAAQPLVAHGVRHALGAAVEAAGEPFAGDEEEVLVDGHVALGRRAHVALLQRRTVRPGDVPDLVAVVVPLDRVVAEEREVGVGHPQEVLGGRRVRHETQVPRRAGGVHPPGPETDAWIGGRGCHRGPVHRHGAHARPGRRKPWRTRWPARPPRRRRRRARCGARSGSGEIGWCSCRVRAGVGREGRDEGTDQGASPPAVIASSICCMRSISIV